MCEIQILSLGADAGNVKIRGLATDVAPTLNPLPEKSGVNNLSI